MAEERKSNQGQFRGKETRESEARMEVLRARVENRLLAVLYHPLVPEAFKDVFKGKK